MSAKQSITKEESTQLQKLQQLFHKHYLTPEFLHQLIAIYVKAIQSFGNEYLFMRGYFMDKMQFVLGCPEIIKMLEGGEEMANQIRSTIRSSEIMLFQQSSPEPKPKLKSIQKTIKDMFGETDKTDATKPTQVQSHQHKHTHEQHHHYHYDESKNNQKGIKIDMKMKLMREVEENIKNIHKEVSAADKRQQKNEEKVKDITKNQDEIFKERLAKRKNKGNRKKSVEIKAAVLIEEGEQPVIQPVIKKEELREAQRELTSALFKFTVRMTQRQQRQKEQNDFKFVKGRVKMTKKTLDDQDLLAQEDENEQEIQIKSEKNMKKKPKIEASQTNQTNEPKGRIKTTTRNPFNEFVY